MKFINRTVIAVLIQSICIIPLSGQKYQNGTKLLKGAEVLSGTPLQLDYILENLSDTSRITVNLHEGKTHLVLNDGSGDWREWWYYKDRWKPKVTGISKETDPVWLADKDSYYLKTNLQTQGQSQVHWDNVTNKPVFTSGTVTSVGLSLPNVFSVSGTPVTGTGTLSATFVSQPKSYVLIAPISAPGIPSFRHLMEMDIPDLNWTKITSRPTTLNGYGITDAYTQPGTRTLVGDTAQVLRQLIKNSSSTINPGGVDGSIQYRSGNTLAGNNYFKWMNATNGGHIHFGNAIALGGQPKLSAYTMASRNYTELLSHDLNGRISFVNNDLQISSGQYLNINSMLMLNLSSLVTSIQARNGYTKSELRLDGGYTNLISPSINLIAGKLDEDNPLYYSNTVVGFDQKYGMTIGSEYHDDTGSSINPDFLGIQSGFNLGQQAQNIRNCPGAYVWKKYVEDNFAPKGLTGRIYWEPNEPVLAEESFAFWVKGTEFYLLLRTGGIQKKVQLQ